MVGSDRPTPLERKRRFMKTNFHHRFSRERCRAITAIPAVLGAALLATACASEPPTAQLQAAQQAINDAERVEAGKYAADELSQARNKLGSANTAVESKDMDQALRLAEEARVDAELASARTAAVKAQAVNDELQRGSDAVTEEAQRQTGDVP